MNKTRDISFQSIPLRASPADAGLQFIVTHNSARNDRLKKAGPLKTQMECALSRAKDDKNPTFALKTTEGVEYRYLFLEKGLSTFELHGKLRSAFGKALKDEGGKIALDLSGLDTIDARRCLEALASLSLLSSSKPLTFGKRTEKEKLAPAISFSVQSKLSPKDSRLAWERGLSMGTATHRVRYLADMPPNHLTPASYLKIVQQEAKARKFKLEFLDTAALTKLKAEAFLAVVRADPNTGSGIVHMTIPSKLKKPRKKIALVGKGLCYDTGGYNIKTGSYMNGMHKDMTGSAIAFAASLMLADLHPEIEVHCYMALAENLISPTGYKPDEVVTASNGVSIEVVDTDAEGRMVLSDTLAIASKAKPDIVIDYATLTGAAIRALDQRRSAVFSNRPALAQLAVKCGDISGERTWAFPIGEDYREQLKSDVADILQCSHALNSDHIYAATFLSEFVEAGVPWVHVDLCASNNKGGLGLVDTTTTGFGIRWTEEFVASVLSKK